MKRLLLVFTLALFAQSALAQMGQGYSSYTNYSADANNDLFVTAVVDGSTNCNNIPPGWNCALIHHSGKVRVVFNGVQTESDGPRVTPNSYISVSNTGTVTNAQPGDNYSESTSSEIWCSVAGLIFQEDGGAIIGLRYSAYKFASPYGKDGCLWNATCSGTCSVPGYITLLVGKACVFPPDIYQQCYDAVLNPDTIAPYCITKHFFCRHQSVPGYCN